MHFCVHVLCALGLVCIPLEVFVQVQVVLSSLKRQVTDE
jgi:hypothetical protein